LAVLTTTLFAFGSLAVGVLFLLQADADLVGLLVSMLFAAPGVLLLIRVFASKLVVDDTGVEVVNFFLRRRLPWSQIAEVRVWDDGTEGEEDRTVVFVLRPAPGRRSPRVRAAATVGGMREPGRLVETLDAHAASHGVPSSITEADLDPRGRPAARATDAGASEPRGRDHRAQRLSSGAPSSASRPRSLLPHASPASHDRLRAYANEVVASHPRCPRSLDRLLLARLAVRGARAGARTGAGLLVVVTAWVTYAGLAPEVSVIDRGGVLLVGLAGAVWLVGLVLLPLAAYRRLRRVLERGALATAVVTEAGPSSSDSAGRVEVVRRIDGPHRTFADRSTVQASAEGAPAPGVRTRVLLDPSASRVVLELGSA